MANHLSSQHRPRISACFRRRAAAFCRANRARCSSWAPLPGEVRLRLSIASASSSSVTAKRPKASARSSFTCCPSSWRAAHRLNRPLRSDRRSTHPSAPYGGAETSKASTRGDGKRAQAEEFAHPGQGPAQPLSGRVAPAHRCAGAPSEPGVQVSSHPAQASREGCQACRGAGSVSPRD
jgi:hypothetical protein